MTRIIHVLDHSLPAHSGYTFRTRAIIKAQLAKGWDAMGVTGLRHPLPGPTEEEADGIRFFRTPGKRGSVPVLSELREVGALAARLDQLCETLRPDILHAHSPVLDAMAAQRVAKARGIPLVYEIRAFWEDAAVGNGTGREGSVKYRAIQKLETRAAQAADAVVVICEGLRRDLIKRGIDDSKITVSPNGVDLDLFGDPLPRDTALGDELGFSADDCVIGFIGSFYDYEGLDDLIAAMPLLVARVPNAKLLLVGGGPMADALKAQAQASPVADRIRFVGRVPHEQVDRYYSLVDVLAYPRKRMRLTDLVTPLKPLEAMAQRRLVAASDVGGHRELIVDGVTGTLFAPDDPESLAKAIGDLLLNRSGWDMMRLTARNYVAKDRNWSSNILRYEPVYQSLLGRK